LNGGIIALSELIDAKWEENQAALCIIKLIYGLIRFNRLIWESRGPGSKITGKKISQPFTKSRNLNRTYLPV
jgi:hypothetical protein